MRRETMTVLLTIEIAIAAIVGVIAILGLKGK
jgi:hypothetical protein